jgi:hypothetical protein
VHAKDPKKEKYHTTKNKPKDETKTSCRTHTQQQQQQDDKVQEKKEEKEANRQPHVALGCLVLRAPDTTQTSNRKRHNKFVFEPNEERAG